MKTVFETSFLVSGIMCSEGCGWMLNEQLSELDASIKRLLPEDAKVIFNAEPVSLGLHKIVIFIESHKEVSLDKRAQAKIKQYFEHKLNYDKFRTVQSRSNSYQLGNYWLNLAINLALVGLIIALFFIFPPSLPLTISLATLTFVVTAFTARNYIIGFFYQFKRWRLQLMDASISLGFLLSLAHGLYHSITMPLMHSFSMLSMNFIMPPLLIAAVNILELIKQAVMRRSETMYQGSFEALFPQMLSAYDTYELSNQEDFQNAIDNQDTKALSELIAKETLYSWYKQSKNKLVKGVLVRVEPGSCFPVDSVIIKGNTVVDTSLITGETNQSKTVFDEVSAGAINLEKSVIIYAKENSFNSSINKILLRSNRAIDIKATVTKKPLFFYLYLGLLGVSMVISLAIPALLGILTLALSVQVVIGLLFTVCPCTIILGTQLPAIFSRYQRSQYGIYLREERLLTDTDNLHTLVFDKTGTLTCGESRVESADKMSQGLRERIYLLEKKAGRNHPIAKALIDYYQPKETILFDEVIADNSDSCGLTGVVQGKAVYIGNADFMKANNIALPADLTDKINQGLTAIYVAEGDKGFEDEPIELKFRGRIWIKHPLRPKLLEELRQLKQLKVNLIMLTGDSQNAAENLNHQCGNLFTEIHASQKPKDKEIFLQNLAIKCPYGVVFICDGLNDTMGAREITSAAIDHQAKAAFFTDISLNGSVNYLLRHKQLNQTVKKITWQNKMLLVYNVLLVLAFMATLSSLGIALSPILPLSLMIANTVLIMANSFRINSITRQALGKPSVWHQFISSDWSLGLVLICLTLFSMAVLLAVVATGGLSLPLLTFTGNVLILLSSSLTVSALASGAILLAVAAFTKIITFIPNRKARASITEKITSPDLVKGTPTKNSTLSKVEFQLLQSNEYENQIAQQLNQNKAYV